MNLANTLSAAGYFDGKQGKTFKASPHNAEQPRPVDVTGLGGGDLLQTKCIIVMKL